MAIINDISQNFSCGNAVPTQFLMWERRSHAFPPHYTTGHNPIIIASCINKRNNFPCPRNTGIPKFSLLQGRSVIICHGDVRYLFSKCLYKSYEEQ